MRFAKFLFAAVAVALALAGPTAAQETKKLKMMYTQVNGFASAYVAQEQGFRSEERRVGKECRL